MISTYYIKKRNNNIIGSYYIDSSYYIIGCYTSQSALHPDSEITPITHMLWCVMYDEVSETGEG